MSTWYESNMFWSPVSLGIGLIVTVIAIMKQDLRWLFLIAWPLLTLSAWWAIRGLVEPRRPAILLTLGISILVAGGLDWLRFRLEPTEQPFPSASAPAPSTPSGPSGIARIPPPISPQNAAPFIENSDTMFFSLGDGLTVAQPVEMLRVMPFTPFNFKGYTPVIVHMLDGQMHIRFRVWASGEKSPIEVNDNQFDIRPPGWDRNFTDNALEVIDEHHRVIFQMIKRTPTRILVNGIFPRPDGGFVVAGNGSMWNRVPAAPPGFVLLPLFKYPSWKHRGEYAEPDT